MNEAITVELQFFMISILWGGLLLVIYDLLRIIRNVINHKQLWIAFEDILYWILCGVLIFQMMYKHNNGIIRVFSILGMLIGMILYRHIFSDTLVEYISLLLKKIIVLLSRILMLFIRPIIWIKNQINKTIGRKVRKILKKIKKRLYFTIKSLKKLFKSSKISLNQVEEGDLLSEEKKKKK